LDRRPAGAKGCRPSGRELQKSFAQPRNPSCRALFTVIKKVKSRSPAYNGKKVTVTFFLPARRPHDSAEKRVTEEDKGEGGDVFHTS
jgi:hypothetical protein